MGVDQVGLAVRIPTSRVNNLSCNIWNGVGGILASINQGLVCFSGCQFLRKPPVALSYRYGSPLFNSTLLGFGRVAFRTGQEAVDNQFPLLTEWETHW